MGQGRAGRPRTTQQAHTHTAAPTHTNHPGDTHIMKTLGFHHIAIKCQDLDRSIAFYQALGIELERSWGEGDGRACMLHLGNGNYLELFAGGAPGDKPEGFVIHFAIRVDDTQAPFDLARSLGAPEVKPVTTLTIPSQPEPLPVTLAFVKGPDGEIIEFFQTL